MARTWFTDEKIFTGQTPTNSQNDRVYANVAVKRDSFSKRLLKGRKHFSQSITPSKPYPHLNVVRGWQQPSKGMLAGAMPAVAKAHAEVPSWAIPEVDRPSRNPRKWLAGPAGNWRDGIHRHPEDKRDTARKGSAR